MAAKKKSPKLTKAAALTVAERKLLRKLLAKADSLDDGPRVEATRVRGQTQKAQANSLFKDKRRVYADDGEFCYVRLKKASAAFCERVKRLVAAGDYIFERNDDDVTVYRYADGSRFQRRKVLIGEMTTGQVLRQIMLSACSRDWKLHYDAIAEFAYRIKAAYDANTGHQILQQEMTYLQERILRRGGPGPVEIANGLAQVRTERSGSTIFLPH